MYILLFIIRISLPCVNNSGGRNRKNVFSIRFSCENFPKKPGKTRNPVEIRLPNRDRTKQKGY